MNIHEQMQFTHDAMIYMYMRDFKTSFAEASKEIDKYFKENGEEIIKDIKEAAK